MRSSHSREKTPLERIQLLAADVDWIHVFLKRMAFCDDVRADVGEIRKILYRMGYSLRMERMRYIRPKLISKMPYLWAYMPFWVYCIGWYTKRFFVRIGRFWIYFGI